MSKERLTNKFIRLKYESQTVNPVYNPKISPGPAIENISSKKLSYVEEKFLEQGPKFWFFTETGSSCRLGSIFRILSPQM